MLQFAVMVTLAVVAGADLKFLSVKSVRAAQKTFPTGDPSFAVMQAFPSAFTAQEADPFLMCDMFGPMLSEGPVANPDEFPISWHPHRGMDVVTYLIDGIGRHADSMGNREEFASPGMQWCAAGSGIEHAEGGGTPAGQNTTGFQIWINVPAQHKMDDPRYGTVQPADFPMIRAQGGVLGRVIAGTVTSQEGAAPLVGPLKSIAKVQVVDYVLPAGQSILHSLEAGLDNCIVVAYRGAGAVCEKAIAMHQAARLGADEGDARTLSLKAGPEGLSAMVFAGRRLNEPIAWHGPIVMNSQEQLQEAFMELRRGTFLKKRASWDYRRAAAKSNK